MKTDEEILAESARCGKMYFDCVKEAIQKARESEREKTRTETAKEIFEKLENAFETILGYDAKGEDVICWKKFVKIRDAIQKNKKETEKQSTTPNCQYCSLPLTIHTDSEFCPPGTEEFGGRR